MPMSPEFDAIQSRQKRRHFSTAALRCTSFAVAALALGGVGCMRQENVAKEKPRPEQKPSDRLETPAVPERVARANQPANPERRDDRLAGPSERRARPDIWAQGKPSVVLATWYKVPPNSLAKRRAADHEFTAAHNRLPLGTLVRVTHLKNGKSVNVRITDRGIRHTRVKIDLCKEAAEELEMVTKGLARVRMQVLAEGGSATASHTAAPQ